MGTSGDGVERRTVLAAAWSVPVVVAAVAAPAVAASGLGSITVEWVPDGLGFGDQMVFFTNDTGSELAPGSVVVSLTGTFLRGVSYDGDEWALLGGPGSTEWGNVQAVPDGARVQVVFWVGFFAGPVEEFATAVAGDYTDVDVFIRD